MPEYLPLGAFRQGLLPVDCRACAWWQTTGEVVHEGTAGAGKRHEWVTELENEWGCAGLLVYESTGRRGASASGEVTVSASIHFAPASSLARFRELPFPPLPAFSALLFCLRVEEGAPRWPAKRLIRKALDELRNRGVQEVYAVARQPEGPREPDDCRFFSAELLAANGFAEVSRNGHLCLMRVDNRGFVSLVDQVETAVRRVFAKEPAPSPAAWVQGETGAEQSAP